MDLKLHKEEKNRYVFEGIPYRIPPPFFLKNGVIYIVENKKEVVVEEPVILKPAFITAVCKNIDTENEKIELTLEKNSKKIFSDKSILYSKSKIIQLADRGLQVNSLNSSDWIKFLSELEVLNEDVIPVKLTTSHLGWIDNQTFMPFRKGQYELDVKDDVLTWTDSIVEKGNLKEWVFNTYKSRQNYIFRFILACSFAAPLLKLTDTRSFVVYNWAQSKGGKTSAAYVALSVWGKAENLKVNFDATAVGIEGLSKIFVDLPILVDEKMIEKNQQKVEKMIYGLASGKTKLRGTSTGSVQSNAIWRCITLSTGEEPLSNKKSQDGVRSRIIEIYGRPFDDESEASRMYKFTQDNCGVSGKMYINYLIQNYSKDNYEKLRIKLDEIKEKLRVMCSDINFAQLSYISLVTLADILIGKIFYKTTEKSSYEMAEKIVENIYKVVSKDLVDNAFDYVGDWVLANENRFDRVELVRKDSVSEEVLEAHMNSERGYKESFGIYSDDIFYIWPTKFDSVLEEGKFNTEKVKQGFKERGYIECKENGYTVPIFYSGSYRDFIAVKLKFETTHELEKLKEQGLADKVEVATNYTGPTAEDLGFHDTIKEIFNRESM